MAGPVTREASAQQARTGDALRETIITQLDAVRQTLGQMSGSGIPAQVTYSDPNFRRLLDTLATNAQLLGIEIRGTTPQERFRSLNNWLNSSWRGRSALGGRNQDSVIDNAALTELIWRINTALVAVSAPGADEIAAAVGPTIGAPQPPATARPAAPAAPTTARPAEPAPTARPAEPVPATTARPAAPVAASPGAALRSEHGQVLIDLEYIAQWGRTAAVKRSAQSALDALNAQFDSARPSARTVQYNLQLAQRLISRELEAARNAAFDQRLADLQRAAAPGSLTIPDREHAGQTINLAEQIEALYTPLRGQTDAASAAMKQRLLNVFLLDYSSMQEMFWAIKGGNTAQADQIFAREQAFYAFLVNTGHQIATAAHTEVAGSSIPTGERLRALEAQHRRTTGTYYNLRFPATGTVQRRIPTGRDDVARSLQRHVDTLGRLRQQSGNLSYLAVRDLLDTTSRDSRAAHLMVRFWDYSSSHGVDTNSIGPEVVKYHAYTAASIVDPDFVAFDYYPTAVQDRLIRARVSGLSAGQEPTAAQRETARRQLRTELMASRDFRYQDVLQNYLIQVMRLAPESSSRQLTRIADVRGARRAIEIAGLDHLVMYGGADWTEPDFTRVRELLQLSIARAQSSGMAATDPVLRAAQSTLGAITTSPSGQAERNLACDRLLEAANGLMAIREAELWADSASARPSSLATVPAAATAQIAQARSAYVWNFSRPALDVTYYSNLPSNLADDAATMLAPSAYRPSEDAALYAVRQGYDNPDVEGVTLRGDQPTLDERLQGAAAVERIYLRFLTSLRNDTTMLSSPADSTLSSSGLSGPGQALGFYVGRDIPSRQFSAFPDYREPQMYPRRSLNPIDQRDVQASGAFSSALHEHPLLFNYGRGFIELRRQLILNNDPATEPLLRGLELAPNAVPVRAGAYAAQDQRLRQRFQAIAGEYGLSATEPILGQLRSRMLEISGRYSGQASEDAAARSQGFAQRRGEINSLLLGVLDLRIAQLEARLSGNIVFTNGRTYRVSDLARSTDERAYYVTRAGEMLDSARTMRAALAAGRSGDLFRGGADPREAIAIAETGIESLSDRHIRDMTPPVLDQFQPRVGAMTSFESGGHMWGRFTASIYRVPPTRSTPLTAQEAAGMTPLSQQQIAGENLRLNWIFYHYSNGNWYILNPYFGEQGHEGEGQFIARIMQVPGGGYAAVRVTRPGERTGSTGSVTIEWEPVRDGQGNLDVLFQVQGTGSPPFVPVSLSATATSIATLPMGTTATVRVPGDSQAMVVLQSGR